MKRAAYLSFVLAAALAATSVFLQAQAKPAANAGRTIEIQATDQMKFSVTTIEAKPGERLHVVLKVVGTMPKAAMSHNFVLLAAGTDATAFANAAIMSAATAYIPADQKAKVLASTGLAGGGETVEVSFAAPAKAGTYTFICSFPGHFGAGMKGTLVVK